MRPEMTDAHALSRGQGLQGWEVFLGTQRQTLAAALDMTGSLPSPLPYFISPPTMQRGLPPRPVSLKGWM